MLEGKLRVTGTVESRRREGMRIGEDDLAIEVEAWS